MNTHYNFLSPTKFKKITDIILPIKEDLGFLTTKKQRAAYIGCIFENLGDMILFDAFKSLFPNYYLYSKNYYGKLLRILKKDNIPFDLSFLGGGTLINVSSGILNLLTRCKTKKRVVFGTGVADPSFWSTIENSYSDIPAWLDYLNSCDYIGVRGPLSAAVLKEWGVQKNINVVGDPVICFSDEKILPKRGNKTLGINLGIANGRLWGKSESKVAATIIPFLKHMINSGWNLKFLPVWENDCYFLSEVIHTLGLSPEKVMLKNFLNLAEFKKELRTVDLFIGEKLHSVILAACTYTPLIMIEYQPKCKDFMESINMGQYNVRCDSLETDKLIHLTEMVCDNIESIQKHLFVEVNKLKNILASEAANI